MNRLSITLEVANGISERLKDDDEKLRIRVGYHAIPSMPQLHLHIISEDFDSECLKTKKHYQSFATSFFIDANEVIRKVEKDGKMVIDPGMDNLLTQNMHCLHCGTILKNMPTLRRHVPTCSSK